jgi:ankyrin repeat protein
LILIFLGNTALHFCLANPASDLDSSGNEAIANFLSNAGADSNQRNVYGLTPLEGLNPAEINAVLD